MLGFLYMLLPNNLLTYLESYLVLVYNLQVYEWHINNFLRSHSSDLPLGVIGFAILKDTVPSWTFEPFNCSPGALHFSTRPTTPPALFFVQYELRNS